VNQLIAMNSRYSVVAHSCLWLVVAVAFLALLPTEALKHNYYTRRDDRSLIGPLGFPFGFLDTGHYNLTVFDFQLSPTKKPHKHDSHSHSRSLAAKDDTNCDSRTEMCLSDVLDNIKGVGFLLKKFEDEAAFNRYIAYIQDDPDRCIFQKYLDSKEKDMYVTDDSLEDDFTFDDDYDEGAQFLDDDVLYDDFEAGDDGPRSRHQRRKLKLKRNLDEEQDGSGEVINAVQDGIYLDMLPRSHWKPNQASVAYDFRPGEAGFYFLMYQVCHKIDDGGSQNLNENIFDIHSRFELDFHFSNKDMFNHISYLSRGEMNLPWLFFAFSLMYAVCLYVWHSNIQLIKGGKPGYFDIGDGLGTAPPTIPGVSATPASPTIYPIHYLMGFLLALKFFSLLFEAIRYHYLRVTGHAVFFSAVYYSFAFLKGITLFTVILLIGSGWSFVKPFLTEREKKMILGVLILQVINNLAIVVLTQETEGEISFDRWTAILHLVDILCCCAVLMPIVWQVNQLEKNMEQNQHKGEEDNEDGIIGAEEDSFINKNNDRFLEDDRISENEIDGISNNDVESSATLVPDARMVAKLKLFRSFYILVIAYIYMTRIAVYLFAATLNYKHTWIPVFVVELTTIFFYTAVGYMFRPMNENPHMHIRNRKSVDSGVSQVEMRKIDPGTKSALD